MKLSYLANRTRPDIAYVVNKLAQYQNSPTIYHMKSLIHVCLYLRKTYDYGLLYMKPSDSQMIIFESELPEDMEPYGYADASYGEEDDRKSRSGYAFFAYGCLVSWASRKQNTVSLSSTVAVYIALAGATEEAIWLRQFLEEVNIKIKNPTVINQDNKSTIAIALNPVQQKHTKYLDIKLKFLEDHIKNGKIHLTYCNTNKMIADIFTKPLTPSIFKQF